MILLKKQKAEIMHTLSGFTFLKVGFLNFLKTF